MIQLFKHFMAPEAAAAVAQVLASSVIGQGSVVDKFELALTDWIGPNVVVNSGTSALWLAYDLAGIRPGDIVISTPLTCAATNIPLVHLGARILWADVDPETGLIDPTDVHKLLTLHWPHVRAIVTVDYAGALCDYARLVPMANAFNVPLVADCAHSFGLIPAQAPDFRAYSFQAIKFLTTGDGGSLHVRAEATRDTARLKRWFGLDRTRSDFRCDQTIVHPGYKFHMTDIAASIGLANLQHVGRLIALYMEHAAAYDSAGLAQPPPRPSVRWLYNIRVADRTAFIARMAEQGVQVAQTHARNDRHPIFQSVSARELPGTREYDDHFVSIPSAWHLCDEDVAHVISAVKDCR